MSIRRIDRYPAALSAALLGIAGCAAEPGPQENKSSPLIMDQLHNGGTVGFLFLPPMVPRPASLGDIVPELPVTVQIDELSGGKAVRTVATFTSTSGPQSERIRYHAAGALPDPDDKDGDADPTGFYLVRWHSDDANLSLAAIYRARVLVPARGGTQRELGFADVDVVRTQKQFRSVDQTNYTPLINGQTLRIKFRIDRPAVDQDGDGVLDWLDNCPTAPNADQADSIGNGTGDACRCDTLPADFGRITCKASAATVDASRKELVHDFGGGATASAHLELSCAATSTKGSDRPTTIHSGALYVSCGATTFVVDPSLGPGVQRVSGSGGAGAQGLRYDQKLTRTQEACTGGTCTRVTMAFDLALGDLRAAGLPDCHMGWSATATEGPAKVENGRLLERGRRYPGIHFGALQLWHAQDKTQEILETLDGTALAGAPSRVRTVCGRTADHGAPAAPVTPTLCHSLSESADRVDRYGFQDLHMTPDTARPTDRASFGSLGQLAGGFCPGGGDARNLAEAYRLPLKLGQAQATLALNRAGTDLQLATLGAAVSLKIAAQAPGGAPVALRTLNVDEWPDTGALVVDIPADIAGVSGSAIVITGTFDRNKKDPPPPPPPEPGPMDHIDLALDVDVK